MLLLLPFFFLVNMLLPLLAETTGPSLIAYIHVFAIQRERVLCIARRQRARARLEIWMLLATKRWWGMHAMQLCKRSERNNIILLQLALHYICMWTRRQSRSISSQSKGAILLSGLACGGLWPEPKQPSGTVVAPSLPKAA